MRNRIPMLHSFISGLMHVQNQPHPQTNQAWAVVLVSAQIYLRMPWPRGFPGGSAGEESACNARDLGLTPGLGRSPGGRHDNLLQYSHLENPMDRFGLWSMGSQRVGHNYSHWVQARAREQQMREPQQYRVEGGQGLDSWRPGQPKFSL